MVEKIKKIKDFISSRSAMTSVSAIIMLVLLIVVTIAWFVIVRVAYIDDFSASTLSKEIYLSTDEEGEHLLQSDGSKSFNVDAFSNVTSDKLVPGVTGSIDIYVHTQSDYVNGFVLRLDNAPLRLVVAGDTGESEDRSDMLKEHIKFYADQECTYEFNMDNIIEGYVSAGSPTKVTLYFKWFYECPKENATPEEIKAWDEDDLYICNNKTGLSGTVTLHAYAKTNNTNNYMSNQTPYDGVQSPYNGMEE